MADRSFKKAVGVLYDVLVKADRFILPTNFLILNCEIDYEIPIIIGRKLLAMKRALIDIEYGEIKIYKNNKEASFSVCQTKKQPIELKVMSMINMVDEEVTNAMKVDLG